MTEATPRPWRASGELVVACGPFGDGRERFIANIESRETDVDNRANAALIVAAVNADDAARTLAEAAREVIRSADASDTWTSLIGILDEAQAAYRAARGEAA